MKKQLPTWIDIAVKTLLDMPEQLGELYESAQNINSKTDYENLESKILDNEFVEGTVLRKPKQDIDPFVANLCNYARIIKKNNRRKLLWQKAQAKFGITNVYDFEQKTNYLGKKKLNSSTYCTCGRKLTKEGYEITHIDDSSISQTIGVKCFQGLYQEFKEVLQMDEYYENLGKQEIARQIRENSKVLRKEKPDFKKDEKKLQEILDDKENLENILDQVKKMIKDKNKEQKISSETIAKYILTLRSMDSPGNLSVLMPDFEPNGNLFQSMYKRKDLDSRSRDILSRIASPYGKVTDAEIVRLAFIEALYTRIPTSIFIERFRDLLYWEQNKELDETQVKCLSLIKEHLFDEKELDLDKFKQGLKKYKKQHVTFDWLVQTQFIMGDIIEKRKKENLEYMNKIQTQKGQVLKIIKSVTDLLEKESFDKLSDKEREYCSELFKGRKRMISTMHNNYSANYEKNRLFNVESKEYAENVLSVYSVDQTIDFIDNVCDINAKILSRRFIDKYETKFNQKQENHLTLFGEQYNLPKSCRQNLFEEFIKTQCITSLDELVIGFQKIMEKMVYYKDKQVIEKAKKGAKFTYFSVDKDKKIVRRWNLWTNSLGRFFDFQLGMLNSENKIRLRPQYKKPQDLLCDKESRDVYKWLEENPDKRVPVFRINGWNKPVLEKNELLKTYIEKGKLAPYVKPFKLHNFIRMKKQEIDRRLQTYYNRNIEHNESTEIKLTIFKKKK